MSKTRLIHIFLRRKWTDYKRKTFAWKGYGQTKVQRRTAFYKSFLPVEDSDNIQRPWWSVGNRNKTWKKMPLFSIIKHSACSVELAPLRAAEGSSSQWTGFNMIGVNKYRLWRSTFSREFYIFLTLLLLLLLLASRDWAKGQGFELCAEKGFYLLCTLSDRSWGSTSHPLIMGIGALS